MEEPDRNVPPHLLPHVHLVAQHRFPTFAALQPEQAVDFLRTAPAILRDKAPVAWQFFSQPPPDGQALLIWRSARKPGWASDGYIWADREQGYSFEVRGYSLEVLVHQTGLKFGQEAVASHKRTRYRLVRRAPGVDAQFPPPDPSLWLVHYSQAEHRIPAERMPMNHDIQRMLQDRQNLSRAGQLQEKQFMLHDHNNHPKLELGGSQATRIPQGGVPGRQSRGQNGLPPRQAGGGDVRPAKRLRGPGFPGGSLSEGEELAHRNAMVDDLEEENTAYGDLLDHLTPSEISKTRYTQHHEWMEEVFSSPYAPGQIAPMDLGLGFSGELSNLTYGILKTAHPEPISKDENDGARGNKPPVYGHVEPEVYHKLEPGQLEEFKSRVEKYERGVTAEIEQLKAEHAKKLADLKRTKTYINAERRLRDVGLTSSGLHEETITPDEKIAKIVRDLETSANIKIVPRADVALVEKGGLIEEAVQPAPTPQANGFQKNGDDFGGMLNDHAMETDNAAASLLDEFTQNSGDNSPGATGSLPAVSQPLGASSSHAGTPITSVTTQAAPQANVDASAMPLGDDMDLDLNVPDLPETTGKSGESEWVMVDEASKQNDAPANPSPAVDATAAAAEPAKPAVSTTGATTSLLAETNDIGASGSPGIFDSGDFGSFDNLDTAGDDALADFTNDGNDLGLDLDNSAFGDAFQGAGEG